MAGAPLDLHVGGNQPAAANPPEEPTSACGKIAKNIPSLIFFAAICVGIGLCIGTAVVGGSVGVGLLIAGMAVMGVATLLFLGMMAMAPTPPAKHRRHRRSGSVSDSDSSDED